MNIINPATEEVITSIADDNPSSLARKFELLKSAERAWRQTTLQERIAILNRFYGLLEDEKESLANTLTAEVGKPIQQSRNEINGARVRIKWMLDNAEKY